MERFRGKIKSSMETHSIIPNTTQIPNRIIDEWMPRLKDVELRVLILITRQTLGWVEDVETGRRKERDWISQRQLIDKTGRSRKHLSAALKVLIETYHLVEATDVKGRILNTADKRQGRFGQIFYRLTLTAPQPTLFDTRASKGRTAMESATKRRTQKGRTTKETLITKENTMQTPPAPASVSRETQAETPPTTPASTPPRASKPSPHRDFVDFFFRTAQRARGVRIIITGADGKMLKLALERGITTTTLEQAACFFLYDPSFKIMAPTIKTFLSGGVITGLLNRMKNDPEFWKRVDNYAVHAFRDVPKATPPKPVAVDPIAIRETVSQLHDLKSMLAAKFAMPKSYQPVEN